MQNITIGELTFNGKITSLDEELTVGGERKYTWVVEGSENFKPGIKNFNTFNYKKTTVTSRKNSKTNAPAYIKALYKCTPVKNCKNKSKCVYYLQKLLRSDGYYLNYLHDGIWCTYTQREFEKWQKRKAKISVTGKWDKNCKTYIKKRFNIETTHIKGAELKFESVGVNPL